MTYPVQFGHKAGIGVGVYPGDLVADPAILMHFSAFLLLGNQHPCGAAVTGSAYALTNSMATSAHSHSLCGW